MMDLKKKNRGYTLIEVLIAMAIFAIGFLALASIQIKSITQNASARIDSDKIHYSKCQCQNVHRSDNNGS